MQWKIDGNPHFLDEERVMKKFMPFVTEVCRYVCRYPPLST